MPLDLRFLCAAVAATPIIAVSSFAMKGRDENAVPRAFFTIIGRA
jgi:hypothetical protein